MTTELEQRRSLRGEPEPPLAPTPTNGAVHVDDEPEFAPDMPLVADPTVTIDEFVARTPDDTTPPLIECEQGSVLPAGGLGLAAGKTSSGKTTWIVDLCLHAAAGADYCGLTFARPLRVLIVENEGPRESFRQKLERRIAHGPERDDQAQPVRIWDEPARWGMVRLSDEELRARIRTAIELHAIDVVVSDTLTRFGVSGNGTPEETRDFMTLLVDVGLGRDVAFLILLHTRTRNEPGIDELEQIAGAWAPHADAVFMLKKLEGNRSRLSYPKTRFARGSVPASILAFEPETETFTLVATDDETPDHVTPETYDERVLAWLEEHPWCTTDELDEGVEGRATEVRAARKRLKEAGRVCATPSAQLGRPGKGMRWNLAPEQAYDPVPLPGTPLDAEGSAPAADANPVRPVRPSKEGRRRDGVAERADSEAGAAAPVEPAMPDVEDAARARSSS